MLALASVRDWVDEMIVIDSGSSDDTVQVAESLGARVLYHEWPGYGLQKRFGEEQCKNRWLLNLDADEEITPQLMEEIKALFARGEPELAGYVLCIRDLLPGETKLAPLAHTNYALRLYNKEKARFSDSKVHDTVELHGHSPMKVESAEAPQNLLWLWQICSRRRMQLHSGKTAILNAPALHRSFRSLAHALEKMNFYTSMQAENLRRKGMKFPMLRLITEFPLAFFKDYILRGYILRGRRGFVNSVLYGFTRFVRVAKYLEKG